MDDVFLAFKVPRSVAEGVSFLADLAPLGARMARTALLSAERLPAMLADHREAIADWCGRAAQFQEIDVIAIFDRLNPDAWRQGCADFRALGG